MTRAAPISRVQDRYGAQPAYAIAYQAALHLATILIWTAA